LKSGNSNWAVYRLCWSALPSRTRGLPAFATCRNEMRCIATRMAFVSLLDASPVCYD